jgi:hypothetical protein
MNTMETITTTILALNGTLIGALIWVVKILIDRLSRDLQDTAKAIRDLREYQVMCAKSLETLNENLIQIARIQKEDR